jgi:hypothetical protein
MFVSLSLDAHVLEFQMNHLNLLVRKGERLAVGQILNHLQLLEQIGVVVEMVDVNLVQILVDKPIIQTWFSSLGRLQVENGAAYLEKVSRNLISNSLANLRDQDI